MNTTRAIALSAAIDLTQPLAKQAAFDATPYGQYAGATAGGIGGGVGGAGIGALLAAMSDDEEKPWLRNMLLGGAAGAGLGALGGHLGLQPALDPVEDGERLLI